MVNGLTVVSVASRLSGGREAHLDNVQLCLMFCDIRTSSFIFPVEIEFG